LPLTSDSPIVATSDGVRVAIRLTPRSRADRIDGITHLADGAAVLKVAIGAPAIDGRANEALLRFLAAEWGLPRRDFVIVGGLKSRSKIVRIAGEPAGLLKRLGAALSALPRS
jgi:uncharacterized protein